MEEIDGIQQEYRNQRFPTFAHCLRTHLAFPASVLDALDTCWCCQRHRENRRLVTWTIFNASETLPGAPIALGYLPVYTVETSSETEHVSDSGSETTDVGPDSP
jgi:hypothetical protein